MPLAPTVTPTYTKSAVLRNVGPLLAGLNVTHEDLARHAGCHKNTVAAALAGQRKQYAIAHHIFTAINAITGGNYAREEHVLCISDDGQESADPTLAETRVFPRVDAIIRGQSARHAVFRDAADLSQADFARIVTQRIPVCRHLVQSLFKAVRQQVPDLIDQDEIFR